jgi:hypothetical protein
MNGRKIYTPYPQDALSALMDLLGILVEYRKLGAERDRLIGVANGYRAGVQGFDELAAQHMEIKKTTDYNVAGA